MNCGECGLDVVVGWNKVFGPIRLMCEWHNQNRLFLVRNLIYLNKIVLFLCWFETRNFGGAYCAIACRCQNVFYFSQPCNWYVFFDWNTYYWIAVLAKLFAKFDSAFDMCILCVEYGSVVLCCQCMFLFSWHLLGLCFAAREWLILIEAEQYTIYILSIHLLFRRFVYGKGNVAWIL